MYFVHVWGATIPHHVTTLLVTFCKWGLSQKAGQDHCQSEREARPTLRNLSACSAQVMGSACDCNVAIVLRTKSFPSPWGSEGLQRAAEENKLCCGLSFLWSRLDCLLLLKSSFHSHSAISKKKLCPERMLCLLYATKLGVEEKCEYPRGKKMQVKLQGKHLNSLGFGAQDTVVFIP